MIKLKRVYEKPSRQDGERILVERLWPRGLSKERAAVDLWLKDVAPSAELRKWFGHDPERWPEFQRRYTRELQQHETELEELRAAARKGNVTLLFGAHDEQHNDAVVLQDVLLRA